MAETRRILSIGPLPRDVIGRFEPDCEVTCVGDGSREEALEALDGRVVVIIARGSVMVDGSLMDRAPALQAVARTGVGYDTVCVEDATRRGIPVLYTPGAMTRAVAELTMAFLLTAFKKLNFWREALCGGDWDARYREKSRDLAGAVLGIVGYGRIGREVRLLSRPFDVRVLANDPYIDHGAFRDDDVDFVGFDEVLSRSDAVTLHVPLTEETRHMIDRSSLARIKPGALLINTARGSVVESLDLLLEGLENGPLAGVALDVFPDEPPLEAHPLFRHPRALVTGHVAARTPRSQARILETMVREVEAVLAGRTPNRANVVNPEVLK